MKSVTGGYPDIHCCTKVPMVLVLVGTGAVGIGTDRGTSTGTCTGTSSTGTGTPKLEMVSGHPRPPSAIKAVSEETDLVWCLPIGWELGVIAGSRRPRR